ncbi:hypothetical protein CFE53_01795 [Methanofervidicoccus sp. A16]|uniref:class III signal peptide-containing protein n=1 Tax=Methanofervidicoccus sp. A16 TaxID=2607662 RepID=UPI00118B0347|nr:class III signal peptide-containing protein [Methanofervidicoccus sp. A16]AXI24953.1 hypothetical protein CFE53_01795 [Methanofervidicoccus sp. A16]
MKMCKIRGQISLELIMLILVALLGAVVVGVTIPNNLVNITSVEDTKEVVFEGFIRGGGTPVSFSGGNNPSNSDTIGNSNAVDNSTTIVDHNTSNNGTIDNNSTEDSNTEDNSTVVLPDLIPVELIVQYENGSEITRCGRCGYRHGQNGKQNTGKNHCQCSHKHRHHNNDQIVKIIATIENQGGNISSPFDVALMINNKIDQIKTKSDINSNTWTIKFDGIKVSTNKCWGKCHGRGKGCEHNWKNCKNKNCDREVNYTFTIIVDYSNTVNESNENNNKLSVNWNIRENGENSNNDSNYNYNDNNTAIIIGGRAESLTVILSGTSGVNMGSGVIPNAKSLSGYVEINNKNITNAQKIFFNVKGNISGKININGKRMLHLGNLSEIGTLNLTLNGNSSLSIINVQRIENIRIDGINGSTKFTTLNANINTMDIGGMNGNTNLIFDSVYIDMLRIGGINGKAKLTIKNSDIDRLEIGGIGGSAKLIIKNSFINHVVVGGGVDLINSRHVKIINSTIDGQRYD